MDLLSRAVFGLLLTLLVTGCGGGTVSAESVVRAWNEEVNAGDNEAAAELFAEGARVVQVGRARRLVTRADAVSWNASLPCSARIVSLSAREDTVTAVFVLADRETSPCDGPGARATTVFRVRDGKIVLWQQVSSRRPTDVA